MIPCHGNSPNFALPAKGLEFGIGGNALPHWYPSAGQQVFKFLLIAEQSVWASAIVSIPDETGLVIASLVPEVTFDSLAGCKTQTLEQAQNIYWVYNLTLTILKSIWPAPSLTFVEFPPTSEQLPLVTQKQPFLDDKISRIRYLWIEND